MSQRTITHIVRLVRPAKTQISLRLRASWSESSLITCTLYNLWAIQRGINENPCHTGWMFRLIWVFAGHTGLFVGFVRWLKLYYRTIWIATSENAPSDMCAQWSAVWSESSLGAPIRRYVFSCCDTYYDQHDNVHKSSKVNIRPPELYSAMINLINCVIEKGLMYIPPYQLM